MNPLMQSMGGGMMGGMGGPFPQKIASALQAAGMMNLAMQALAAYKSGRLDEFAQQLYQTNPQFRQYADQNKGKTLGQIAQENGVNLEQIAGQFRG